MCGIVGVVGRASTDIVASVTEACSVLAHRGPDGRGSDAVTFGNTVVALGHTRLSILDLDERGLQPMWGEGRRFCVVFNGEIYNYRELRQELRAKGHAFQTETDTEVLLAAWSEWGSKRYRA